MYASRLSKFLVTGAVLLFSAACTHVVPVTGSIPTPVVDSLPLSVGVYFDDEFRDFTHAEDRHLGEEWVISSGELNAEMFSNLFATMFERTVAIDMPPDRGVARNDLDALIQVKVTEYGFLTPRETGQRFFAVSFKYRILMWEPDGTLIANWQVVGYGKSAWTAFKDEAGLSEATAIAIRDGAATVALGFEKVPSIAAWLAARGLGTASANPVQASAPLEMMTQE